MKFKAWIDGNPTEDEPLTSNDAEEVTIEARHTTYTMWIDGEDLIIKCDGDFTTIHLQKPRQIRLETK